LNEQVTKQFEGSIAGLGHKDYHWSAKPIAHILEYDLEHKAQWLGSIELARTYFVYQHKFEASSIRHQREFMISWILNVTVAYP
jgi:hypothetical protein